MNRIRKMIRAEFNQLGDDEVEVVMSTASLARDGHVLDPQGCRLENYRANPIVLWSHDADKPIGNVEDIVVGRDNITARIRFAPLGISAKADEIRGLTKAGVIRSVSVGFDPTDGEPLDAKKPRGGQHFTEWELLELSFVSVPADPGATVTARAHGESEMADTETDGTTTSAAPAPQVRDVRTHGRRTVAIVTGQRGMWNVAQLANLIGELGYQTDWAKWEADIEQDGSKVPAMMAEALYALGDAFIAMATEEVAELIAGLDIDVGGEVDDAVLIETERAHIRAATNPRVQTFRRALATAKLRAGRTLSSETVRCLREARAMHDEAMDMHRSAIRKHKDGLGAIDDMLERSGASDAEDTDNQTVQTSSGTDESEGSSNGRSADFRRRQADALSLTHTR